jgi:hypothetical protein
MGIQREFPLRFSWERDIFQDRQTCVMGGGGLDRSFIGRRILGHVRPPWRIHYLQQVLLL